MFSDLPPGERSCSPSGRLPGVSGRSFDLWSTPRSFCAQPTPPSV